jgi:hypothetical protein
MPVRTLSLGRLTWAGYPLRRCPILAKRVVPKTGRAAYLTVSPNLLLIIEREKMFNHFPFGSSGFRCKTHRVVQPGRGTRAVGRGDGGETRTRRRRWLRVKRVAPETGRAGKVE